MGISNSTASLLAAASVIALSVGMEPALADGQNNNGILIGLSKQNKADSDQQKGSQQIKGESYTVKMGGSQQYKQDSNFLKYQSQQHKVNGQPLTINGNPGQDRMLNPQPLPPKQDSNYLKYQSQQHKQDSNFLKLDSQQHKLDANHIKMDSQQWKGDSVQQKGNSLQQKGTTKGLNPQPEPPG